MVLGRRGQVAILVFEMLAHITIGHDVQARGDLGRQHPSAGLGQGHVEGAVQRPHARQVGGGGGVQFSQHALRGGALFVIGGEASLGRGLGLQLQAQFVDFLSLGRAHAAYEEAPVGVRHHQSVLLQTDQGLAQRNLGHVQFCREGILPNRHVRLDDPGQDHVPHHLHQAVGQGADFKRGCGHAVHRVERQGRTPSSTIARDHHNYDVEYVRPPGSRPRRDRGDPPRWC
ncbi:hypothetical protein D3C87_1504410 [compost metagenome]